MAIERAGDHVLDNLDPALRRAAEVAGDPDAAPDDAVDKPKAKRAQSKHVDADDSADKPVHTTKGVETK